MLITEKQIKLKNNQTITLRSATKNDAKAQCEHWTKTAYETPFLARYPEECIFNLQEIENELELGREDRENTRRVAGKGEKRATL